MKVVLYFGSFNPVHIGHMAIANYVCEYADVDALWFVVSPHNPLKQKKSLLDSRMRFHLVELAIDDYPKMRASDIEFNLSLPSFTVHTLMHLRQKHPNYEFQLLMGADNLVSLHKWKNFEYLLENYPVWVYPRPDVPQEVWDRYPMVQRIDAPLIEISSTFIRESIARGKDVRFYMPAPVSQYIEDMLLYRG